MQIGKARTIKSHPMHIVTERQIGNRSVPDANEAEASSGFVRAVLKNARDFGE